LKRMLRKEQKDGAEIPESFIKGLP
jgi:hypothetical protein